MIVKNNYNYIHKLFFKETDDPDYDEVVLIFYSNKISMSYLKFFIY
jgi:hypothetical protein